MKRAIVKMLLTAAILPHIALQSQLIKAAPGDLDTTFSGDGKLTDIFPGITSGYFTATVVQSDGKIIAVGSSPDPRYIYVGRYNPDGSPDTTFGAGTGKVATQFGNFYNSVSDVALQPDGKIVLVGCYCEEDFGDYNLALARLNSDGSRDTSFGAGGVVTRPDIVGPANSVAIQTDGKIVVAGQAGFFLRWLVARFNSNGSLDTTFNDTGIIVTDTLGGPNSVAIQTDGKIVATGSTVYTGSPPSDFAIVRYNPNGSLDTTFDGDGIVVTAIGPGWDDARSVAIQADGKIVAAGTTTGGSDSDFALARYNTDGSLDTTFAGNGIVTTPIGPYGDAASSIVIQSDGKIVAAGTSHTGSNDDFALARYHPNGSLDATFGGGDGKTTTDFDITNDRGFAMALDNFGRAVVVGTSSEKFAIARFRLTRSNPFDFDGDRRSDTSVFRPGDSVWYLDLSAAGFTSRQFGISSDELAPADYDGDGKTDIGVYRNGTWWRMNSSDHAVSAGQFGISGDLPVPADFTGDGRDELAVYRSGQWWMLDLSNNQSTVVNFGLATDKPIPADYDGDLRVDQAVYRDGEWHINRSTLGYAVYQLGLSNDRPVVGDYDGDGNADLGVYRDGTWYLLQSSNGVAIRQFGLAGDKPLAAAYLQ